MSILPFLLSPSLSVPPFFCQHSSSLSLSPCRLHKSIIHTQLLLLLGILFSCPAIVSSSASSHSLSTPPLCLLCGPLLQMAVAVPAIGSRRDRTLHTSCAPHSSAPGLPYIRRAPGYREQNHENGEYRRSCSAARPFPLFLRRMTVDFRSSFSMRAGRKPSIVLTLCAFLPSLCLTVPRLSKNATQRSEQ